MPNRSGEVIRIMLVDDHAILRRGVRALLDRVPTYQVVAEAGDGEEALERLCEGPAPDVVLLDLSLPDRSGIDCLHEIASRWPQVRVLVLTMHDEVEYLREALQAGASGFLPKHAADRDLLAALTAVVSGDVYVHPEMGHRLILDVAQRTGNASAPPLQTLSDREQEVLRAIALGYTNREIAEQLELSVKTVETYKERIAEKLQMRRRFELVRYALRTGLVREDESS